MNCGCINRNILECKVQITKAQSGSGSYSINRNILECKVIPAFLVRVPRTRINRNILECKVIPAFLVRVPRTRINRNILECKENADRIALERQQGINRNILECKEYSSSFGMLHIFVLIETYWNVKIDSRKPLKMVLRY